MRPPGRRSIALPLVLAVLLAAACSSPEPEPSPTATTADPDERIATILELRPAVGPAASEVGSAVATLAEQVEELAGDPPAEPDVRRRTAATIRSGALTLLTDALEGFGPDLAGEASGPDAEAVRAALDGTRTEATALAEVADRELALVERTADAEDELATMVAAWSEPGSRNEQLELLAEVAEGADDLADELGGIEDVPTCARRLERRAAAARTVASATRELRALVEARRGEEFDARRQELLADPYGTGGPLVDGDRADADCWRREAPVVDRAAGVAAALADLEAALNPADLASPGAASTGG